MKAAHSILQGQQLGTIDLEDEDDGEAEALYEGFASTHCPDCGHHEDDCTCLGGPGGPTP